MLKQLFAMTSSNRLNHATYTHAKFHNSYSSENLDNFLTGFLFFKAQNACCVFVVEFWAQNLHCHGAKFIVSYDLAPI